MNAATSHILLLSALINTLMLFMKRREKKARPALRLCLFQLRRRLEGAERDQSGAAAALEFICSFHLSGAIEPPVNDGVTADALSRGQEALTIAAPAEEERRELNGNQTRRFLSGAPPHLPARFLQPGPVPPASRHPGL